MRTVTLTALCMLLTSLPCLAQDKAQHTGSIRGEVFTKDGQGQRFVVPGTLVELKGPLKKEKQSDASGAFEFHSLPPGRYAVSAKTSGMNVTVQVEVKAGESSLAQLELRLDAVTSSVSVTADDAGPSTESVNATTVERSTIEKAPNQTERFESLLPLVPGVVRGPDGLINMKGARSTQNGWLVNSANVTDPATGGNAISLPIDVVSSVEVNSNPYDPEYGKFTGAISSVQTRTGNMDKFHASVQNLIPRARDRDGDIVGIAAFTPRVSITGPLLKDRVAFTQSLEYRFVRTPVESLPALSRDTRLESFDSFSQVDAKISGKQTATFSFALFPQKVDYLGLNTFTPQSSTPDLHQRGYQFSMQHHYATESGGLITSQVAFEDFDGDVLANSDAPYQLMVETTEGGFFNQQKRRSDRTEWRELYQSRSLHFYGTHQLKVGLDFTHNSYDGDQRFRPVSIFGTAGHPLERIDFSARTTFSVHQNEFAWFMGDQWNVFSRLNLVLGLRFDRDSVTDATHAAPRAGFTLALTADQKTLLKGGAGLFYDRVPLNAAVFPSFPDRTLSTLDPAGQVLSSKSYANVISGPLRNPRSGTWNLELDRQLLSKLLVRVSYQQRNTVHDLIVTPIETAAGGVMSLANRGRDSYREFQITGKYQISHHTLNASYVRSRAFGDLNDFNQFFGNNPTAVIQPNGRGRLPFDAPNRFLAWGEFAAPWKLTVMPVLDLHTGFPYSVENQAREFVGPRNERRFPRFSSADIQILREVNLPLPGKKHKVKIGLSVFNIFNRSNPRDVQNIVDSYRFGQFFNSPPRTFRGKFVFGF